MLLPSVRNKVAGELDKVTLELEEKVRQRYPVCVDLYSSADMRASQLAPKHPDAPSFRSLPGKGLSASDVSTALTKMSELPNTKWENGRVSGAVYHGGKDMGEIWKEAFGKFEVANPLHADVFPGAPCSQASVPSHREADPRRDRL